LPPAIVQATGEGSGGTLYVKITDQNAVRRLGQPFK
jgi:hypothetical protein